MKKSHLILKNLISRGEGVRINVPYIPNNDKEENEEKDYEFQAQRILKCQKRFYADVKRRHSKRDAQLRIPHYDYISINFFKPFRGSASKWGLKEMSVTNMGLTTLFWIEIQSKFESFMKTLNDVSNDVGLLQSVKGYKQYTLINSFELLNSDSIGSYLGSSSKLVVKLIPKNAVEGYDYVFKAFNAFLGENRLRRISDTDAYSELFEIDALSKDKVEYIKDNFDVVQAIQSIPLYRVTPNQYAMARFTGVSDIDKSNTGNLPVIGLIDSGIDPSIEAFKGLVVKQVSIIEEPVVVDEYHGTSVASLIVFGKQNLTKHLVPQAKIYSIQVYRARNNKFSLLDLKNAIIAANRDYHVRVFNISMSSELSKDINSDISAYAQMLDELSYKYDMLFVIATGNTEDLNEEIPYIYYDYDDPNRTQDKNIGEPSECMNGITVGAMFNKYPALYTKKSYIDYTVKVNGAYIGQGAVNINLHKPDVLIDGGKDASKENGILVLSPSRVDLLGYSCGTSLATPFISNLCAQMLQQNSTVLASTLKALIINSTDHSSLNAEHPKIKEVAENRTDKIKGDAYCKSYNYMKGAMLCRMIEGHGIVDEDEVVYSDENKVTIVVEEEIKNQQIIIVKLKLPESLKDKNAKGKILKVFSILCYTVPTGRYTDPINYNRYFVSYRFFNADESEDKILKELEYDKDDKTEQKDKHIHIKGDLDHWSDSFRYISSKAFSNVNQIEPFLISHKDLISKNDEIGIAFQCVHKDGFDTPIRFSFCMRIELVNKELLKSGMSLYDELCAENNVTVLNENIAEATATLDV